MKCATCSAEIPEGAPTCPACAASAEVPCRSCGRTMAKGLAACPQCGALQKFKPIAEPSEAPLSSGCAIPVVAVILRIAAVLSVLGGLVQGLDHWEPLDVERILLPAFIGACSGVIGWALADALNLVAEIARRVNSISRRSRL